MLEELRNKERKEGLAIGWVEAQQLEIILFDVKPNTKQFTIPMQDASKLAEEYKESEFLMRIHSEHRSRPKPSS